MVGSSNQSSKLRVVQSVLGAFWHFDLARELAARGNLERIFSTFPWSRLKREDVPRELVSTYPVIHPALMLLVRWGIELPESVRWSLDRTNANSFDSWVSANLPPCDVLVAISGSGIKSGRVVQGRGAKYVCDRGSSHIRFQDQILTDEYRRWGVNIRACDPRVIYREEQEYAQADAITVPSEFARRSFLEMGVSPGKVYKVPYGVRLENFSPVSEPPTDSFEVLFVGGVGFRKGIPYLLDAFDRFAHPRKRLRIVGGVQKEIRPYLSRKTIENVEFVGIVPQRELKQIMSSSHVMVMPSLEEGLALVQAQALASGCPLISSTNTGGSDLFTHGVEGFEVPIRSVEAIVERLQQLADDPQLQQRMRNAGIARVQSLGGWQTYGDQYLSVLNQLVSGQPTFAA
jgi:glycosyltransferase involved in cell wall biosynthesis